MLPRTVYQPGDEFMSAKPLHTQYPDRFVLLDGGPDADADAADEDADAAQGALG